MRTSCQITQYSQQFQRKNKWREVEKNMGMNKFQLEKAVYTSPRKD